jgi:hypothetical protein
MSFQPPPGDNPPPPPPPGQWNSQSGGSSSFDPKTVSPLDWGIIGAGFLTFIFSFVSWYTFSYHGFSVSENAWHGFFGWFAMLLALIGSALVAMDLFAPQVKLPIANRLAALGAYALATLCMILAIFIIPGYLGVDVPSGVDEGHGWGYWLSFILILAGLVMCLMRAQQTGTAMPGALGNLPNIGSKGPQGGSGGTGGYGGGTTPPPPTPGGGYGGGSTPPPPPPSAP